MVENQREGTEQKLGWEPNVSWLVLREAGSHQPWAATLPLTENMGNQTSEFSLSSHLWHLLSVITFSRKHCYGSYWVFLVPMPSRDSQGLSKSLVCLPALEEEEGIDIQLLLQKWSCMWIYIISLGLILKVGVLESVVLRFRSWLYHWF